MIIPRAELEQVRRSAPIANVLHNYGLPFRLVGNKLRGPCPKCGGSDQADKCVVIDEHVYCHACEYRGDVFDVCMMHTGTDLRGAFELLGGNLELANVRLRVEIPAVTKAKVDRPDDCEKTNRAYWERLAKRNQAGELYLRKRGIEVCADVVRFDRRDPCVPLRSFDDGRIVNVVRRRIDEVSGPKVLLKRGSGHGCFGDVRHLEDTFGEIIITEGLPDYLTALGLSTDNLVIGARDAASIPKVVEALANAVPGRRMAVVMHPDAAGKSNVCKAIQRVGVRDSVDKIIRVLVPKIGDLNDAWMEANNGN